MRKPLQKEKQKKKGKKLAKNNFYGTAKFLSINTTKNSPGNYFEVKL